MPLNNKNLEQLKEEHKGAQLFHIKFEDGKELVFKQPDRKHVAFGMAKARTNPLAMVDVLIENCVVAGDFEHIKNATHAGYHLKIADQVDMIIGSVEAQVKKL